MMMHLGVEQFEKPGIAFEIDIPEGEGGAHHKMAAGKSRMKTIHSAPFAATPSFDVPPLPWE